MAFCADGFPAGRIDFLVLCDVLGQGVEGKVGCGKGEVGEEGGLLVFRFVLG